MSFPARAAFALSLLGFAGPLHGEVPPEAAPARFRLFPEEPPPPPSSVRASAPKPRKRFWMAAGELLGLEAASWAFDRYVANQDYARISWGTVHDNLDAGFTFDSDKFTTNQIGHSFGGSFYFNAGRSNGFDFWESTLFAAAGSAIWEIAAETQGPSLNDLVNTTLGGAVTGEATYRLSQMLLDDRARGGARFAREALAGIMNPSQLLTRLLTGELSAVRPERGDYVQPSRFVAELDLGWHHYVSSTRANPDLAFVRAAIRYGDPFDRSVSKPFDAFDLGIDFSWPGTNLTRVEVRGLLGGWDLDPGSPGARHVIGIFMDFDYTNTDTRSFSSQSFRFGLLSMRPLGKGVELRAELLGAGAPLVALRNDHLGESSYLVGRAYDYGVGAAVYSAVRFRRKELDLVTLTYSLFWTHTSNGIARNSSIQSFRAEARVPVAGPFSVGGSWSWGKRISTYDDFDTFRTDATQGRAFLSWTFR
ncbi:MAG: DUF3943 domain-containing protein [Acidobacteriota bacterium]|nr:DUF3943 domain-containing protein [Acidobacteriota bacterium]